MNISINKILPWFLTLLLSIQVSSAQSSLDISQNPLFLGGSVNPRVMLSMSRDLEMFKEAYPDYSDLNNDGKINFTYTDSFSYYGYFESNQCYTYSNNIFTPVAMATGPNNHHCSGNHWSGNFLNWATMTRMDVVRKILYGGYRSTDTNTQTILQRSLLSNDATAFSKVFTGTDDTSISDVTPFTGSDALSMCNVTWSTSDRSDNLNKSTNPPQLRVARGEFPTWAATEVIQCAWRNEKHSGSPNVAHPQSTATGSNSYNVRVEVCKPGFLGENCTRYPNGNFKPTGLLQDFGGDSGLYFGLITGSYDKNTAGGVLRRNIGPLTGNEGDFSSENEWDPETGIFANVSANDESIINTVNRLRISRWDYSNSRYDDCRGAGNRDITSSKPCSAWGNPIGEIFLESLRYFSGQTEPTASFSVGSSDSKLSSLPVATWRDPIPQAEWCAVPANIILSSGTITHDSGSAADFSSVSDLPGLSGSSALNSLTNTIGNEEGISSSIIAGGSNRQCTAETINNLSSLVGVCPDAPDKLGGYNIAGLAWHARTNDMRPDHAIGTTSRPQSFSSNLMTYAVNLAEPLPRIQLGNALIVPTCESSSRNANQWGTCSPIQTDVLDAQYNSSGDLISGHFRVFWEDSGYGNDWDMDGTSDIIVCRGNACSPAVNSNQIRVKVDVTQAYAGFDLRFGFFASGTNSDGLSDWVVRDGGQNFQVIYSNTSNAGRQPTPIERTLTIGSSPAQLLNNPLWYAAKWGGFKDSNNSGKPDLPTEWDSTGNGIPDNYIFARDPSILKSSLETAFRDILAEATGGASSVVAASSRYQSGESNLVYQALFDSSDWSGDLVAYDFLLDESTFTEVWRASGTITSHENRSIYSHNGTDGILFDWTGDAFFSGLSETQRNTLSSAPILADQSEITGEDLLNFLRGDPSNEMRNNGLLRNRSSLLGNFINSNPALQTAQLNFNYNQISGYNQFRVDNISKPDVVYVGGNAGMLHAFDAQTGEELFAYVPNAVFNKLPLLADPNYSHQFFVDGQQTIAHAQIDGSWRTVLIGTLGAGGRGIYALDITDPTNFSADDVLWDLTSENLDSLGYTFGAATVARTANNEWSVLFANGYASNDGEATLLVAELETGSVREIETGVGNNNGLSEATFRANAQGIITDAFAGDLKGNLWKFDLTSSNTNQWDVAFSQGNNSLPLFTAFGPDDLAQPITARPIIGSHPDGGSIVFFGTGKYFESTDNQSSSPEPVQSFYGIRYYDGVSAPLDRDDLLEQEFIGSGVINGTPVRVTTSKEFNADDHDGWYIDLNYPTASGERVISRAVLVDGRVEFITITPASGDPCAGGGTSSIVALNAATGARPLTPVFDLTGTKQFGDQDMIEINGELIPPSAIDPNLGIASAPTIIRNPDGTITRLIGGTEQDTPQDIAGPAKTTRATRTWIQLR